VKRFFGLVVAFSAASCIAPLSAAGVAQSAAAAAAKAAATKAAAAAKAHEAAIVLLAPADQYFGKLQLSVVGMRNTIRDLGLRYDVNHDIALQTYDTALLAEISVRDWEKKYPHDDQLPHTVFYLQRLYTKILIADSRARAQVTALWLFADFPKSPQARQLRNILTSQHLAPLPPPTPTPTTTPTYGSVFGSAYSSQFAPGPSGVASPGASPVASPSASPAASPVPTRSAR
jgi:hypothetical protein